MALAERMIDTRLSNGGSFCLYLPIVQPVLDLLHLPPLNGIDDVEVLHDHGNVADNVTENSGADNHPSDREDSLEVGDARDIAVPHRRPVRKVKPFFLQTNK